MVKQNTMAELLRQIQDCGVIVVVRAQKQHAEGILPGAEAVMKVGCKAIEITFSVPDAVSVIRRVDEAFGNDILLGAGTVMTPADAVAAVNAGARYLVAPNTNPEVIGMAKRLGVPVFPGALSPSEVVDAWNAGADAVKIFPASIFGPAYIKALRGPLPHIPLVPTGGISAQNAGDYIKAGAFALGAGSNLFDPLLLAEKRYDEMTARAREFCEAIAAARG